VFSPDGRSLATLGPNDESPRLWDRQTGAARNDVSAPVPRYLARGSRWLLFSPDGKYVVNGASERPDVCVRDAATGAVRLTLLVEPPGMHGGSSSGEFSPDGRLLVVASGFALRFWQVPEGKQVERLEQFFRNEPYVYSTAHFVADGRRVFTGAYTRHPGVGEGRFDRVWDLDSGAGGPRLNASLKADGTPLLLSPNRELALVWAPGTIEVIRWAEDRRVFRLQTTQPRLRCAAFTADSRRLVTSHDGGAVVLRDLATGAEVARVPLEGGPQALAVSPDGKVLATYVGGDSNLVTLWKFDEFFRAR
jgi:WD40 repeat protein